MTDWHKAIHSQFKRPVRQLSLVVHFEFQLLELPVLCNHTNPFQLRYRSHVGFIGLLKISSGKWGIDFAPISLHVKGKLDNSIFVYFRVNVLGL